jgi:hypothetical protein
VLPEERSENGDGGFGARVGDGLPGKLVVGGQVADRKGVGVLAVDRPVWLKVVHRPDGAGTVPAEPMDEPLVLILPDASEAAEDVLQLAARHSREGGLERRHTDAGSGQAEQLHHLVA